MHDCPDCGGTCYCDGEDHAQDAPADCRHNCPPKTNDEEEPYVDHNCSKCQIGECDECLFYTPDGSNCECDDCGGAANLED